MAYPSFSQWRAITKSDTVDAPLVNDVGCHAVWIGEAGVVQVVAWDGTVTPFTCAAGTVLPVRPKRINSTSTAGTLFVGLWAL